MAKYHKPSCFVSSYEKGLEKAVEYNYQTRYIIFLPIVGKSVVGVESNLDSIRLDNSASIVDWAI